MQDSAFHTDQMRDPTEDAAAVAPVVAGGASGLMTGADKTKLDALPASMAVPGAIGTTTPAAGSFTTLGASGVSSLLGGEKLAGSAPVAAADQVQRGVADINGAGTAAEAKNFEGGAVQTSRLNGAGVLNVLEISESVADDGTISLPAPSAGRFGVLEVYTDAEHGKVLIASDAAIAAIGGVDYVSTNFALTDADGNLCVFDAGTTITVRNRLGSTKWVMGTYRWA